LRASDAAAADTLYRSLIEATARDAAADSNDILTLSTPLVSPQLLLLIDEHGALQFYPLPRPANVEATTAPPFARAIRQAFYRVAASVLLRPAVLGRGATEAQERVARYFTIGRLLPFFEREATQYAPELQARAAALLSEFTESSRASLSSQLDVRNFGATPSTDELRSHFEERGRTSDNAERDRITTRIVLIAARTRSWDRARRAAAELSDEGLRRAANSFIAVNQVADISHAYADEKEDDYESIVSFLKSADVPPLAAAWGYAQAAQVAARKADAQRVAELLTEAEHYAERTDASNGQRIAAYGVVAIAAARLDKQRAWELLTRLVKAANSSENYAGDEASIEIRADENSPTATEPPFNFTADVFRLESIFATMAHLDFERALTNARALEGDTPRVFAQLAIARAALEKK
jgi:hypothetical protein